MSDLRPTYRWGQLLSFAVRGSALPYCLSGWCEPEVDIAWTNGLNARLSFGVEAPSSDIDFALSCSPYLGEGKVLYQELHVFANFLRVGFATLNAPGEILISIPQYVLAQPTLILDFYMPRAVSPAFLRVGPDIRQLGIAVTRLAMTEQPGTARLRGPLAV